jgi:hypothetical protein
MSNQQIKCPSCSVAIDVSTLLYQQLNEQVQQEFKLKFANLEKEKSKLSDAIDAGVKAKLTKEKASLESKLRAEISSESGETIRLLEEQLDKKSGEIKQMNKLKTELLQTKREKDELESKIYIEAAEKFDKLLAEEKGKTKDLLESQFQNKLTEKDMVISNLRKQTQDMQRRIDQGSTQAQGESAELILENCLKTWFPTDSIKDVGKGIKGADLVHSVNTRERENIGAVLYERKNTKAWSENWIKKAKSDQMEAGAMFVVIVTEVMPPDMPRMGQRDGCWVCNFQDLKSGISDVLREAVVLYGTSIINQENQQEKMQLLFNYLTSPEFKFIMETIVSGFVELENELAREKRAMEAIWKRRSMSIQKVLKNSTKFYSSIRAIAGNSIQEIKTLELLPPDETSAA